MRCLLVVHHSHTDVGYTELQGRVARWHADFIRQALEIAASPRAAPDEDFDGFRWTCETFWGVERFLERASPEEREAFADAVRAGTLGLSGSWANVNELIDEPTLRAVTGRAAAYGAAIDAPVRAAMTADVNGASWGFAQVLLDAGVRFLFTCVHTHHGMFPLGRTQAPFRWETPRGDRLLVWSGEHYHFGNELGLVPGAVSSYLTKDECDADTIFHDPWRVAEIRIPRYLERLEAAGYPLDVVPVMASGLRTDNGPPSIAVVDQIRRWNREHGDVCRIEMATLEDVLRALEPHAEAWPVHRGDWPDWWSDGAASCPEATRLLRQAQRDLGLVRRLRERRGETATDDLETVVTDLALYAEHTFSHSDAMSAPWHLLVHGISGRKKAFAARALDAVRDLLDDEAERLGDGPLSPDRPLRYRVLNPTDRETTCLAGLPVGHHEFHELGVDRGAEVVDETPGETLPRQPVAVPRGAELLVPVRLAAGEVRKLLVRPGIGDALDLARASEDADALETPRVRIAWEPGEGIVSWGDRATGRDLLRPDRIHAPFTPIHEITPVADPSEVGAVRGAMELNRKGPDAVRSAGRLTSGRITARGDALVRAELRYEMPGTTFLALELTAHVAAPRVDVAVRMAKDCRWEPESVYLSLPFTAGPEDGLHLFKTGAIVRPRIDQIPGTLTDFYAVQEGWVHAGDGLGVVVASLDGHLLWLGPLEHGERRLAGDPALSGEKALPYAWLMNNVWETNFDAGLGGFHEFRYVVTWGAELADPTRARAEAEAVSTGPLVIRLGAEA